MRKIIPIPTGLMIKHMALMALKPNPELQMTSMQKLRNEQAQRQSKGGEAA